MQLASWGNNQGTVFDSQPFLEEFPISQPKETSSFVDQQMTSSPSLVNEIIYPSEPNISAITNNSYIDTYKASFETYLAGSHYNWSHLNSIGTDSLGSSHLSTPTPKSSDFQASNEQQDDQETNLSPLPVDCNTPASVSQQPQPERLLLTSYRANDVELVQKEINYRIDKLRKNVSSDQKDSASSEPQRGAGGPPDSQLGKLLPKHKSLVLEYLAFLVEIYELRDNKQAVEHLLSQNNPYGFRLTEQDTATYAINSTERKKIRDAHNNYYNYYKNQAQKEQATSNATIPVLVSEPPPQPPGQERPSQQSATGGEDRSPSTFNRNRGNDNISQTQATVEAASCSRLDVEEYTYVQNPDGYQICCHRPTWTVNLTHIADQGLNIRVPIYQTLNGQLLAGTDLPEGMIFGLYDLSLTGSQDDALTIVGPSPQSGIGQVTIFRNFGGLRSS